MSLVSAIGIYFVIWWLVLFMVLPWGVRTQHEEGEITPGSNPSSPVRPMLWRKALATTLISFVFLGVVYVVLAQGWLDFRLRPPAR